MTRRQQMQFLLTIALASSVLPLRAHDDIRVVGVVTKVTTASVSVKNKEGKNFSIKLNNKTKITRDKADVGVTGLKTGDSVVIDARGDSEADIVAEGIRIVPGK